MSFILDALRKSEAERQRQAGPGLVGAGQRPPARRRTVWVPLLVLVLAANLVFMLWWGNRQARAPQAPSGAPPTAAVPPEQASGAARPLAAEAGLATVEDAPFAATADLPAVDPEAVTEVLGPPEAATGMPAAAGPAAIEATGVITEGLPTAEQLVASGALAGPALHLDIHVFSSNPAERFVFINMRKYSEGMALPEGPRLEEITPEGAVFSHNGQRFLLARD